MFVLTPEALQDISVKCVSKFMTKEASLSEVIAKEAQELELNSEQIKRVIETSNTLSYLRMIKDASDRTFEFPVAEYNQVLTKMAMPDSTLTVVVKTAANSETTTDQTENSVKDQFENLPVQEKMAMLRKEMLICREVLTKMAYDKETLKEELLAAAKLVNKDPLGLEKLAMVVEEDDYDKMLALCNLEKKAGVNDLVFLDSELINAKLVYSIYKEAETLLKTEAEMEDFLEKSAGVITNVLSGAAGKIGQGIGWGVTAPFRAAGKNITRVINEGRGFKAVAKVKGVDIDRAVKDFSKVKATQGTQAALAQYGGHSPNLIQRHGGLAGVAGTAFTGLAGVESLQDPKVKDAWNSLN
jgi:hypothetical protein